MDMDFDNTDIDSDEENEIQDLEQLNAVLGNDDPCSSNSVLHEDPLLPNTSIECFSSNYAQYSKVETALALNKMCDEKLRRLEKILQSRLFQCRRRLSEVQRFSETTEKCDKAENFRYVYCGKPYFKDKNGFPAPDNQDTLLMQKLQMYNFSGIASVPGWTVKDKCQLTMLIHKMSKEKRKKELNSQIAEFKRKNKLAKTEKNDSDTDIGALRRESLNVCKMSLKSLALPIDQEYDWDYIANKLSNRHSAQEYRSLWKLFLHPSINKSVWSRTEHIALQKIAFEKKLQDWDAIAEELGTGRTNYQCFVYFRTNMNNTFTSRKWTREEEEYLKRLIEYYREDNYIPWGKVAASMENRTKVQIYNKYSRLCELRKGKFLPEEDSVILTCVDNFGPNFRKVTEYLQGRSVTQCRDRYQVLAKRRYSAVWTIDEDRKLIQLMANQDASTNFSTVSQYFPGKDRVHIRSRYITLTKWMKRNPNVDISRAPRRAARRLGHGKSTEDLNRAIECLKKRLQCEITDKKNKKITKESPEYVIDDAIVAILTTENIRLLDAEKLQAYQDEQESNVVGIESQNFNVSNLHKLLILMKAKLNRLKFSNSPLRNTYQGLLDASSGGNILNVRSYSRREAVKSLVYKKKLDIWGNQTLGQLSYVLPPHYSTITGCRKLMSYYVAPKNESEDVKNINVLIKRNMLVKEQVNILMERFNSLFLWPMLLSNASPDECKMMNSEHIVTFKPKKKFPVFEKGDYDIVMPIPKCKKMKDLVNDEIDLKESNESHKIPIDEDYFDTIP